MLIPSLPESKKKNWWTTPLVPYIPQPKGTPWYAVNWGATIAFFGISLWFGLVFFVGIANGVPERKELQTLFVKVIKTYSLSPHLLVELADGQRTLMEFPVNPSLKGGGRAYIGWNEDVEGKQLIGCNTEVHGIPMKWTFDDRFRVFELICQDKRIAIGGLEVAEKRLKSDQMFFLFVFLMLWLSTPVPAFIYVLYRERNYHHE